MNRCLTKIQFGCLLMGFLSACGTTHAASSTEAGSEIRYEDGKVFLPESSRQFVELMDVTSEQSSLILRAPARLSFQDGAVSRLGFPLSGRVKRIHVQTGDTVTEGEPLITVDAPEAASVRASLVAARAFQQEAIHVMERITRMLEQGVATQREQISARRELAEAEAELERARAAVRFVGAHSGTQLILRAPMDGIVISLTATPGAAIEAGEGPVIEIGDPRSLWGVVDVYERDLHLVEEGLRAELEISGFEQPLTGTVVSVAPVVDSAVRTLPVRIELDEIPERMRPGMFGRARIETRGDSLILPAEAILIREGRESIVFLEVGPGIYASRPVSINQSVNGRVLISSGIAPGDRVVIRGGLLLDGAASQLL